MTRSTKKNYFIIDYSNRLLEKISMFSILLLILIGSLNHINAEDRPVNGKHLLVLPFEVVFFYSSLICYSGIINNLMINHNHEIIIRQRHI